MSLVLHMLENCCVLAGGAGCPVLCHGVPFVEWSVQCSQECTELGGVSEKFFILSWVLRWWETVPEQLMWVSSINENYVRHHNKKTPPTEPWYLDSPFQQGRKKKLLYDMNWKSSCMPMANMNIISQEEQHRCGQEWEVVWEKKCCLSLYLSLNAQVDWLNL